MSAALKLLSFPLTGERSPLLAGPAAGTSQPARAALIDSADQAQAEGRLQIVQALLQYDRDPSAFAHYRLADGTSVTSKALLAEYLCQTHKVSRRTLFNWQKAFREGGLPALADRQRRDKGQSRWFAEHREAAILPAWLYLECNQSVRACYDALVAEGGDVPSYETVRAWLASAPPYLKAWARDGRRAYRERFAPYLAAAYTDLAPNEVWVSDHMIHDVEVANDCFPELPMGAPMRLRFTSIMDRRSRYIVGMSWCPEGSSRSIATALRRAMAQYGPCRLFYCDNGKDFRKVTKGARPGCIADPAAIRGWEDTEMESIEKTGLLGRVGVQVTRCLPFHPQSKNIERAFGTVHHFDRMWHQHYTGGAPHLRPDATAAAMALHRRLYRHGRVQESAHPAASLFICLCMAWIESDYHQTPHGGAGMNGRTPAEVFAERPAQRGVDEHALAVLFAEHTRRRVRECAVEMQRRRYTYEPQDKAARDVLHSLNETDVVVAYDPNDPECVAILDDAGHYLCTARAEEPIAFDPGDAAVQARIADSMADRRHMEKQTRELVADISRAARAIGAQTPVEALASRTAIVPAVAPVLTHRPAQTKPNNKQTSAARRTYGDAARLLVEGLRK